MADETQAADDAAPAPTRLFNGGTQPLVPCEAGWTEGVVMPGESILTDKPESYGSPWTEDAEAAAALSALLSAQEAQVGDTSETAAGGHTGSQGDSQNASQRALASSVEGSGFYPELPLDHPHQPEGLRVEANGDVVNDAGRVVGRIETSATAPGAPTPSTVADQGGNT